MKRWIAICALVLLLVPAVSSAAITSVLSNDDARTDSCKQTGRCTVCDILVPFERLADILMGLTGPILLLVVAYGGFTWLISGGDSSKIEQGRKIMVGGVIGIVIVFAAWEIVNLTIFTLAKPSSQNLNLTTVQILGQPWSSLNCN